MRCVSSDFSHFVRCAAAYCAQETAIGWNATLYDTKRYFSEYGRDVPHCVPQNPAQSMPNLGCGTGTLTAPLAPLCHRVLNVDSSTMVRCAQEAHSEVEFMVCDTLALPFCGERRALVCEFGAHGNIAAIESAFSLSPNAGLPPGFTSFLSPTLPCFRQGAGQHHPRYGGQSAPRLLEQARMSHPLPQTPRVQPVRFCRDGRCFTCWLSLETKMSAWSSRMFRNVRRNLFRAGGATVRAQKVRQRAAVNGILERLFQIRVRRNMLVKFFCIHSFILLNYGKTASIFCAFG